MRGEARESAVFDAGPLIYLDALGYLYALRELHRVIIPEAVARELEEHPGAPGGSAPSLEWIERQTPAAKAIHRVMSEPPSIDAGERETIALALEIGSETTAVMDDRRGRRRARSLETPLLARSECCRRFTGRDSLTGPLPGTSMLSVRQGCILRTI